MNPPLSLPIPEQPLRFSIEAARQLLELAMESEESDEGAEPQPAQKRAINACTSASFLVPPEAFGTPATAAAEQKQAG